MLDFQKTYKRTDDTYENSDYESACGSITSQLISMKDKNIVLKDENTSGLSTPLRASSLEIFLGPRLLIILSVASASLNGGGANAWICCCFCCRFMDNRLPVQPGGKIAPYEPPDVAVVGKPGAASNHSSRFEILCGFIGDDRASLFLVITTSQNF